MLPGKNIKNRLLAAFAVETGCCTYGLKAFPGSPLLSVLYFIAGLAVGIGLLFVPSLRLPSFRPFSFRQLSSRPSFFRFRADSASPGASLAEGPGVLVPGLPARKILIAGMALMVMHTITRYWLEDIPVDISFADMLPIMRSMNQRFVEGHWKQVYDPIPEIWGGVKPIYLPAMWLPYFPAVLLHIDVRWVTTGALFLSFCAFLLVFRPSGGPYSFLTGALAFVLFWWLLSEDIPAFISMSEEGVVVCWYSLLVLALLSGNSLLTGLAVSCCLLSRYALVGWVPAFLLYEWLSGRKKQALIFSLTGLACLLGLFILPFGGKAFMGLLGLPGDYIGFARTVWERSPGVFLGSLGFARFFGPAGASLLHSLLIGLSFTVPLLFTGVCLYRNRKEMRAGKGLNNIPLAALKISVVIFYNFIDVPYLYLFYTSSFVSLIAITAALCVPGKDPEKEHFVDRVATPAPARPGDSIPGSH